MIIQTLFKTKTTKCYVKYVRYYIIRQSSLSHYQVMLLHYQAVVTLAGDYTLSVMTTLVLTDRGSMGWRVYGAGFVCVTFCYFIHPHLYAFSNFSKGVVIRCCLSRSRRGRPIVWLIAIIISRKACVVLVVCMSRFHPYQRTLQIRTQLIPIH